MVKKRKSKEERIREKESEKNKIESIIYLYEMIRARQLTLISIFKKTQKLDIAQSISILSY